VSLAAIAVDGCDHRRDDDVSNGQKRKHAVVNGDERASRREPTDEDDRDLTVRFTIQMTGFSRRAARRGG
jgi:hypothetical protein